jgi:hypothetical protein
LERGAIGEFDAFTGEVEGVLGGLFFTRDSCLLICAESTGFEGLEGFDFEQAAKTKRLIKAKTGIEKLRRKEARLFTRKKGKCLPMNFWVISNKNASP